MNKPRTMLVALVASVIALTFTSTAIATPGADQALKAMIAARESGDSATMTATSKTLLAPLDQSIGAWLVLTHSPDTSGFEALAEFYRSHSNWPDATRLRRLVERSLDETTPPQVVIDWFAEFPPLSPVGATSYALVLMQTQQAQKAAEVVRTFWRTGAFGRVEEADFLQKFGQLLRAQDHEAHLERLFARGDTAGLGRHRSRLTGDVARLAEARWRLAARQQGVDAAILAVPESLRSDPGLMYERLRWRRRAGLTTGAIEILDQAAGIPDFAPENPRTWWTERFLLAQRALTSGNPALAYRLAIGHSQTRGFAFAQAEWFAGWVALRFLNRPEDALGHFNTLFQNVTTPISRARGAYWSGRAAEALGDIPLARQWFSLASQSDTTFYGQLAGNELDPNTRLQVSAPTAINSGVVTSLAADRRWQAAKRLIDIGAPYLAEPFLRILLRDSESGDAYQAVAELAKSGNLTDWRVRAAKLAHQKNRDVTELAYPLQPLGAVPIEPALALAIARQESLFDVDARSHAGALGVMQLMPGTARYVANRLGETADIDRLTVDPAYNIRYGSSYLAEMIERFGGSYFQAIAAYNAGPGRVDQWLVEVGPPGSSVDEILDWIERIPFYETRNYVQRVLENLQVYRARLDGGTATIEIEKDLLR